MQTNNIIFYFISCISSLLSVGWIGPACANDLPNVPGYDVVPIMFQSNNFSGQDYDYVWDTYDHSGAPGTYTPGIDSEWGPKLFDYGWIQHPAQIHACHGAAAIFPCQADFGGTTYANPTAAEFITAFRDNYIPNNLQSRRTGVLIIPCAGGGTGYYYASPYSYRPSALSPVGSNVLSFAHNWGVAVGASVIDQSHPGAIPGGTKIISFTATSVTLSNNIAGPGVSNLDYIQFTNAVGDWQVGGHLYEGCLALTNEAIAANPGSRLVAVFGNGGESDSGYGVSATQYTSWTQAMVSNFRTRATSGTNVPFLFGGMVPYWVASVGRPAINIEGALSKMPSNVMRSAFVDSTGLAPASNYYTGYYKVSAVTPGNPCQLAVTSTDKRVLTNGAKNRFIGFTGLPDLNGSWATTVASQSQGTGATITIPVDCSKWAGTYANAKAFLLRTGIGLGIHFSAESIRELGNRYYKKLVPFL